MEMIITPNLHFEGDCLDAIELYKKAFNAEIICLYRNEEANPVDYIASEECSSLVYHSEILIGKNRLMLSDLDKDNNHVRGNSVSLVITFDTVDEVKNAYEILKIGATVMCSPQSTTYSACFVSFIDRFGIRWELMTEQTDSIGK